MAAKLTNKQKAERRRAALDARRDRDAAAIADEVTRDVLALIEASDMGDTDDLAATRRHGLAARRLTAEEKAKARGQNAAALAAKRKTWTIWGALGVASVGLLLVLKKKK